MMMIIITIEYFLMFFFYSGNENSLIEIVSSSDYCVHYLHIIYILTMSLFQSERYKDRHHSLYSPISILTID